MQDYTVSQAIITDSPPSESLLNDGDHIFYMDGENLVEIIKANGVLFEDIVGQDKSEPTVITGGSAGWTELPSGFVSGNLALSSAEDAIIATDSAATPKRRAQFGKITTNTYGISSYSTDGTTEIFGIHGYTAQLAGWQLNSTTLSKTIGGEVPNVKTIKLTVADSQPRLDVDYHGSNRVKVGYIDADDIGIVVNSSAGMVMQVSSGGAGNIARIGGWDIAPSSLKGGADATTIALEPGNAIWMGDDSLASAKFSVTNAGVLKAISGTIGGWDLTTNLLRSATDGGARVELNQTKNRVSIFDATAEKVTMGYLEGLGKNPIKGDATGGSTTTLIDTTANWKTNILADASITIDSGTGSVTTRTVASNTSNTVTTTATWTAPDATSKYTIAGWGNWDVDDYGFWAAAGDKLVIDGDAQYLNGNWIIQHDASYLVNDSADNTIIRLGTDTGEKGLFLYNTSGTTLAKFHSGGFRIGSASGTANYLEYTSGGALSLAGTFTVQDAVLPALAAWDKNTQWSSIDDSSETYTTNTGEAIIYGYSGNGVTDKGIEGAFMYQGVKYSIAKRQGWNNIEGDEQVVVGGGPPETFTQKFTMATHAPANLTGGLDILDGYIVYETSGGTAAQPTGSEDNCPFEMNGLDSDPSDADPFFRIAFCTRTTTVSDEGEIDVVWKYDPNSNTLVEFAPTPTMVVIGYIRTDDTVTDPTDDNITYMQMFREAIPIATVIDAGGWVTTNFNVDGTEAALTAGVSIASGGIAATGTASKITMHASDDTVIYGQTNSVFLGMSTSQNGGGTIANGPHLSLYGAGGGDYLGWDGATLLIKGDITMDGGSIAWNSVTGSGTVPYDVTGASAAVQANLNAFEYGDLADDPPPLTYIDSGGIYTGILSAQQINSTGVGFSPTHAWQFHGTINGFAVSGGTLVSASGSYSATLDHSALANTFIRPPSISINGELNRYIRIKMRRTAGTGWDGKVFWLGDNSAAEHNDRHKQIGTAATDYFAGTTDWKYILLDMHDLTNGTTLWKTDDAIILLRFDFGSTTSDVFEIAYIQVGDFSVDTPGTYIDSAGIYTGSINCDNLTGGTITGQSISGGTITSGVFSTTTINRAVGTGINIHHSGSDTTLRKLIVNGSGAWGGSEGGTTGEVTLHGCSYYCKIHVVMMAAFQGDDIYDCDIQWKITGGTWADTAGYDLTDYNRGTQLITMGGYVITAYAGSDGQVHFRGICDSSGGIKDGFISAGFTMVGHNLA